MRLLISYILKSISFFIFVLPRRIQLFLGDLLAVLVFDVFRFRRALAMEHLQKAFPEWDQNKITCTARGSYRNLGRALVEYANVPFLSKKWINKNCVVIG